MGLPPSSLTFVPCGERGLVTTFMVQAVPTTEGLELLIPGYNVNEEGNHMICTTPSL